MVSKLYGKGLTVAEGIKFKEMNAEHLMSRLAQIERKPDVLWKALNANYGEDFLLEQIEEEYGATN